MRLAREVTLLVFFYYLYVPEMSRHDSTGHISLIPFYSVGLDARDQKLLQSGALL